MEEEEALAQLREPPVAQVERGADAAAQQPDEDERHDLPDGEGGRARAAVGAARGHAGRAVRRRHAAGPPAPPPLSGAAVDAPRHPRRGWCTAGGPRCWAS